VERPPAQGYIGIDGGWLDQRRSRTIQRLIQEARRHVVTDASTTLRDGQDHHKAKFEFMRADGEGKPICYYTVELENVMISGVNPNSGDGGLINEQVFFAYSKMKWQYVKQSIRGGAEGKTAGGWDCATHKCV
jgi:type VI protein secretion system component Hcp